MMKSKGLTVVGDRWREGNANRTMVGCGEQANNNYIKGCGCPTRTDVSTMD